MIRQKRPSALFVVRHGESAGNVARAEAESEGRHDVGLSYRDVDVPLSELGERQADALGRWFARQHDDDRPTAVMSSPYLRARDTAQRIVGEGALVRGIPRAMPLVLDERLREREFGVLDGFTKKGIEVAHPEQAELRRRLGKFYHRPPGGESWCDIVLRLRSVVDTLSRDYRGERVLLVCHSVVVLCFRYLLERLGEQEILAIDHAHKVANCSITSFRFDPDIPPRGELALEKFNFVVPLEQEGERITFTPDPPTGLD